VTKGSTVIRIVALLVFITSAIDYCAYDLYDPSASMSLARSDIMAGIAPAKLTALRTRPSDLPDDRCLGCSPSIAPIPPILLISDLIAFVVENKVPSLRSSEPLPIDRPPRA